MADSALKQLRGLLGSGAVPEGLQEAQAQQLLALMRHARECQRAALAESAEASLRHIPALLRPAVRRVLMG